MDGSGTLFNAAAVAVTLASRHTGHLRLNRHGVCLPTKELASVVAHLVSSTQKTLLRIKRPEIDTLTRNCRRRRDRLQPWPDRPASPGRSSLGLRQAQHREQAIQVGSGSGIPPQPMVRRTT
jgi:hypothetical protein